MPTRGGGDKVIAPVLLLIHPTAVSRISPPLCLCVSDFNGVKLALRGTNLGRVNLFPIFPFFEVGNLSWSAARIPPKRTSSDRSKSAPKYHDEFRFALRLVRNFNLKAVISIARPLRPIAILCGLVSLNHCSALV
ncbi:hypothetical protein N7530_000655, partial [Penicillium desertorum]